MPKHAIKWTFQSTLTPEQWDALPKFKKYWTVYDCLNKVNIKYIKVEGTKDLNFAYMLDSGRYTVHNNQDKYALVVDENGKIKIYNNTPVLQHEPPYMFVD